MIYKIIKKIKQYSTLVMFEHTIFSLSFGIVAMLIAISEGYTIDVWTISLILVALISARTGANAINRVIDAEIDAANPRTSTRQLPQRILDKKQVVIFTAVCFIIMIIAAFLISPLTGFLSPVALFMMITYSYTKRFTWACHLYLGATCAIAPMGAWLAITGQFHIIPFLLSAINMFWVAGFDIIYGSQDYHFDSTNNIFSIPRRFGVKNGLLISAFFHILAVMMMVLVGVVSSTLSNVYFIGVGIIAILLFYEHKIVSPDNLSQVKIAAYSINQLVSIVFMGFATAGVLLN